MLEHVALHQTRFNTPGVAPDSRGVLLGKQGAVLFASVDKLVAFFRILSEETPLDDLLPSLKLYQVRSPLETRELLVLFHAASSYLVDRAARIAALLGGLTFTGSGKHFVKYRDEAAPLGYDVAELDARSDPTFSEFILYAGAFTQGYARGKEIPFSQLVFRLSPRPIPGAGPRSRRAAPPSLHEAVVPELLWLVVQPGLGPSVLTYLFRNRVECDAALVSREGASSVFGHRGRYLLVRAQKLPRRMLDLFSQVPGIEVHVPVGDHFVVELGFRHPLRLESCQSVFDRERFYVFSGSRDAVDVIAAPGGALPLTPGERLITGGFDLGDGPATLPLPATAQRVPPVEVKLRLSPTTTPPRRVSATLLPWSELAWLKKLVFVAPPTVLTDYRVAAVDEGLLVLGARGVDELPLGQLLEEVAPSIFIPVGTELVPRVSEAVLTDLAGGGGGRVVVLRRAPFAAGQTAAFSVEDGAFEPLGRKLLGRIEVEARARSERAPPPRPRDEPLIHNDPIGLLPLWGWKGGPVPEDP